MKVNLCLEGLCPDHQSVPVVWVHDLTWHAAPLDSSTNNCTSVCVSLLVHQYLPACHLSWSPWHSLPSIQEPLSAGPLRHRCTATVTFTWVLTHIQPLEVSVFLHGLLPCCCACQALRTPGSEHCHSASQTEVCVRRVSAPQALSQ